MRHFIADLRKSSACLFCAIFIVFLLTFQQARADASSDPIQCVLRDNPSVSQVIPPDRINDDYCDCQDGSDEPLTAACPGGSFRCQNPGHRPTTIPSTWLNDTYCDCCDGSDEPPGHCTDTCSVLRQRSLAEVQKRMDVLKAGLQRRDIYIVRARKAIAIDRNKLAASQKQLKLVQSALSVSGARRDALRSARDIRNAARIPSPSAVPSATPEQNTPTPAEKEENFDEDDENYEYDKEEDYEPAVDEESDSHDDEGEYGVNTGADDLETREVEDYLENDGDETEEGDHDDEDDGQFGDDEFDGNQEGEGEGEEEEEDEDIEGDVDQEPFEEGEEDRDEPIPEEEEYDEDEEEEEEEDEDDIDDVHFEDEDEDDYDYSDERDDDDDRYQDEPKASNKDGGDPVMDKVLEEEDTSKPVAPVEWNIDEECAKLTGSSNRMVRGLRRVQTMVFTRLRILMPVFGRLGVGVGSEMGNLDSCVKQAEDAHWKLERQKTELESEIKKLEKKQSMDYGRDGVLKPLDGTCVKQKVLQYEFEHCSFDLVRQYEFGSAIATLGRFRSLSVVDGVMIMSYKGGDKCWNGPVRSIDVHLLCGEKEEILSVDEPNRCSYAMKFRTPAACEEKAMEALKAEMDNDTGSSAKDEL